MYRWNVQALKITPREAPAVTAVAKNNDIADGQRAGVGKRRGQVHTAVASCRAHSNIIIVRENALHRSRILFR